MSRQAGPQTPYLQLPEDEIRLLDLLSRPGEPLKCRLRHAKLGFAQYTALSYVWGDDYKPHIMEVLGERDELATFTLPLTTSLQLALQDLRDCPEIQPKTFWIDQLCIDQDDNEEKSQQVSVMWEIYRSASHVVTYLGPQDSANNKSTVLARRIYDHYRERMEDATSAVYQMYVHPDNYFELYKSKEDVPAELRFPWSTEEDETAFTHLETDIIAGPWASRLWLVQENVANVHSSFLRGSHLLPWHCLALICTLSTAGILPLIGKAFQILELHSLRLARFSNEPGPQYADHLYKALRTFSQGRECRDLRDKIYALLGIAEDAAALVVVPRYDICPVQLFTNLIVSYAENSEFGLRVLDWVGTECDGADSVFPSWVASFDCHDWAASEDSFQFSNTGIGAPEHLTRISFESTSNLRNAILVAKGIALPPLGLELAAYLGAFHNSSRPWDWECLGLNLEYTCDTIGHSDESLASICRALLMDPTWPRTSQQSTADAAYALRSVISIMRLARNGSRTTNRCYGDEYYLPSAESLAYDRAELVDRLIYNSQSMNSRFLYTTQDGRLALVPERATTGDVPVILFGGKWIYFLRPREDAYEYLGWGYVDGLMNSEIFQVQGWEDNVQEFKIT